MAPCFMSLQCGTRELQNALLGYPVQATRTCLPVEALFPDAAFGLLIMPSSQPC